MELQCGTQKKKVANEMKTFCQLAVAKVDCPGAKVARYLGVTSSSINRLAFFEEASDLKNYLKML